MVSFGPTLRQRDGNASRGVCRLFSNGRVASNCISLEAVAGSRKVDSRTPNAQYAPQSPVRCAHEQEFLVDLNVWFGGMLGQWACDVRSALDDDRDPPAFLNAAGSMGEGSGGNGGPGEAPVASCER